MSGDLLANNDKPEYVICTAVWFRDDQLYAGQPKNIDSGFVVCGRRHHNCFATLYALKRSELAPDIIQKFKITQGFLTSKDRFLNRIDAMNLAKAMGQTRPGCKFDERLFSEDLY